MPKNEKDKNEAKFALPDDLKSLSDDELQALEDAGVAEFDLLDKDENLDVGGVARMGEITDGVESLRAEKSEREEARKAAQAQRDGFRDRLHSPEKEDEDKAASETTTLAPEAAGAEEAVTASAVRGKTDVRDVLKSGNNLNIRLSQAQQHTPRNSGPSAADLAPFDATVIVASADVPGFTHGGIIEDGRGLVEAYKSRARTMGTSQGLIGGRPVYGPYTDLSRSMNGTEALAVQRQYGAGYNAHGLIGYEGDWRQAPSRALVAQMKRNFRYNLDQMSSADDAWEVMQAAANPQALVAAGGWCSPSEIRYDFYNIVAMDGAYDLPTTGISRGGMRWPTSPSFGDLASSTGLWHWTETQDIAAATGTAQSGTKTCARVPCAAFNEVRLEGEGICITAGNLTTDAWPEQIANFLRLVNAAHFHRINTFFVNNVIAGSTAVTHAGIALQGMTATLLASIENSVWDLRTKYAMADTDVLEVVLPSWVLGLMRADLSRRAGYNTPDASFAVTNAMIAGWFTQRSVRVQFIQDFDVRSTNQFGQSSALTAWPTTLRYLIYPAGTWLRGNGLTLDLGIVRDSTLNATNDYTAAWSEEFFTLAKIGHESRIVTLTNHDPSGATSSLVNFTANAI